MRRHIATKVCTSLDHHIVTIVLGVEAEVNDPGHHRQSTTKAQEMEEPEDQNLPIKHMIMKTMKKRWERHALLVECVPPPCPKDSNCPIISRNTTDHRSHRNGSQIICKQSKIFRGSKETAMQIRQLHLTGVAWSWLGKLERETIGSREELTKQFTSNFKSTYKRPTSIEEVKACIQQRNETFRSYIQIWRIIKNSTVTVSDERVIRLKRIYNF
jgi:hypothetical protein